MWASSRHGSPVMQLGPAVSAPGLRRQAKGKLPKSLPSIAASGRRYYADSILGSGTAGVVLRYRTASGESLAVKVVRGKARDAEDRACELPRLREVVHQTRVCGSSNAWSFYAMPCASDVLTMPRARTPRAAAQRGATVVASVARALRRLERNHARYYDVKPGNVLCTADGGMMLGDLGSVASTASTYPPPNHLTELFPWYHHVGGFVSSGSRAYALNCMWSLMVSFLVVALPGRTVQLGGRSSSVSGLFVFSTRHIRLKQEGAAVGAYALRLLEELPCRPSQVFVDLLTDLLGGRAPHLSDTLNAIALLG
jgi:hypothetical protein